VDVLRHFTRLKCRLMPYLFGAAVQTHATGLPTMRAMVLAFPADPACDYLDRQYMLGDSLLVAPIFRHDNTVDYYLPAGKWTHILSGEVVEGGGWRRETYDFFSLPLWVRPNSIIPVGANDGRPDYDFAEGVTFHVFSLDEGAAVSTSVPNLEGETEMTLHVRREGDTLHIEAEGAAKGWSVLLRGITVAASIEGGTAERNAQGMLLLPGGRNGRLTVQI
jgi:alpha-D-xyloside xylohydrolase